MADMDLEYRHQVGAALESALRAAEEERNRSGAELHSGVAQDLTGLIFKLTEIQNACSDPATARALSAGLKQADQILERVRLLSSRASPPMLDEIGLAAGLGWLADYARRHRGFMLDVQVDGRVGPQERSTVALLFRWARWLVDATSATAAAIRVTEELQTITLHLDFQLSAAPSDRDAARIQFTLAECVRSAGGVAKIESSPARCVYKIELPTTRFESGTTVLLCDDDPLVRETTAAGLCANGLAVLSVSSPAEALELAQETLHDIHILVTNDDAGGQSCAELVTALRQIWTGLRVVVMRDSPSPEQARSPLSACLEKPFAPRDLIHTIRRLLNEKETE